MTYNNRQSIERRSDPFRHISNRGPDRMKQQTDLYSSLYDRNWPIIDKEVQGQVSRLRLAVAGCGSTGGAFIEGALRLGVQHFHLCDNGVYEVVNLNRQLMTQQEVGQNKAAAYAKHISLVNPHAKTKFWSEGLTPENADMFLEDVDILFDAVDVTTPEGMKAKLFLHEIAAKKKIATGSALDLAYVQWLQSYNYHLGEKALHGRLTDAKAVQHPLKSLLAGFASVEELPLEISDEIIRLIENPGQSACQLACVCFVLAGMATPFLLHFLKKNTLPPLAVIDLMHIFEGPEEKALRTSRTRTSHARLKEALSKLP